MSRSQGQTLGLLAIIATITIAWIFLISWDEGSSGESGPKAQSQPTTTAPLAATNSSVVIPSDFDWDEQDEEWFEELMEQVQSSEDTHSRWNYEFDEVLQPGESIVTDGWEVSEGVFQFTVLTPSEVISDGETVYQVSADITEVGLSGESSNMAMPRVLTRHGMEARIMIGNAQPVDGNGNPTGLPNRRYELSFTPEGVPEGIRLQGSASAIAKKP